MDSVESNDNGKREAASYTYYPLASSLRIGDAVRDLGGANSAVQKSVLARHLGEPEKSPVLNQRIASAKCFGIIEGKGAFTLSDNGRRYYFPTSESDKSLALLDFLRTPTSFAEIIKRFDGTKLPPKEILANLFHREAHVPESWKDRTAAFFSNSAEIAGVLDATGFLRFRSIKERGLSKGTTQVTIPSVEPDRTIASVSNSTVDDPNRIVENTESNVWNFVYKGKSVRLITPSELDDGLWKKLNAYVQLLNPNPKDEKSSE